MNQQGRCPITGFEAISHGNDRGWFRFSSPTAGGDYEAISSAVATLEGPEVSPETRLRLISWLVSERLSGVAVPRISTDQLDPAKLPHHENSLFGSIAMPRW